MRRLVVAALGLTLVVATAGAAGAQDLTIDQIAAQLAVNGYFIEDGVDNVDEAELAAVVETMATDAGSRFYPVILVAPVAAGATSLAASIADEFPDAVTVVVLTPDDIGADSGVYTEAALNDALDAGLPVIDSGDVAGGFRVIASVLEPDVFAAQPAPADPVPAEPAAAADDGGGGGGGLLILLLIVGGLIAVVFFVVRSSQKKDQSRAVEDVAEAKGEIKTQLDAVANEILEDADAVRLSDNAQAKDYFEAASKTYSDALDVYENTDKLSDLETVADALDEARWQLSAADALREGRPVPPKPRKERATCFFDPAHPPATETAVLKTSAGDKEVKVCPADAARLAKGEQPRPRMINVNGRPTPAPSAPRSYGGGGMGWLDAFQVILGGMAAAGALGGGRSRSAPPPPAPAGRSGGGIFGGGSIFGRGTVPQNAPMPRSRGGRSQTKRTTRQSYPGGGRRVRAGRRRRGK